MPFVPMTTVTVPSGLGQVMLRSGLWWSRLLRRRFLPFQLLGFRKILRRKIVQHLARALVGCLPRHPAQAAGTVPVFVWPVG
jgi:hypothetical protein